VKLTGKNITGEPEVYTQGEHKAESSYEEANPIWSLSLSARL
jgi:hypothetical protein